MTVDGAQTAKELLTDPVAFDRGVLQDDPWEKQEDIFRAIARPNARVAVKACHASGKTNASAKVALWFLACFDDAIVVTTAPTWPQVKLLLWGEIHGALAHSRVRFPPANDTELTISKKNYAVGWSTNEGVRFQGIHGPHVLIILDEAPGVRADIWEAIEGARAGGDVRVLALGNPTIASGPFYDAFGAAGSGWHTITISAFDTPNLRGITLDELKALPFGKDTDLHPDLAIAPRPYLTTRRWVREKWDDWGRHDHPLWYARVLGAFPQQGEDALLSLSWLELARVTVRTGSEEPLSAGLDVAGPGEDETVLVVRRGSDILLEQAWPIPDPRGEVVAALRAFDEPFATVNVDGAGIGYYLALHLEDLGFPVTKINVGETASDTERFVNQKAEYYWGLRQRYQEGDVRGPLSDLAVQQLASIRWKPNARGQTVIESKDEARKRGVKSPDRAEAVMLAFAPRQASGLLDFFKHQLAARDAAQEKVAA